MILENEKNDILKMSTIMSDLNLLERKAFENTIAAMKTQTSVGYFKNILDGIVTDMKTTRQLITVSNHLKKNYEMIKNYLIFLINNVKIGSDINETFPLLPSLLFKTVDFLTPLSYSSEIYSKEMNEIVTKLIDDIEKIWSQ